MRLASRLVSPSPRDHAKAEEKLLSDENALIALDLLQRTSSEKLDEAIGMLKKQRPARAVRAALIELLVTARLSDFASIERALMKHFGNRGE